LSLPSLLTRPFRIIPKPRKVVAEICERPATGAALLIFVIALFLSVSVDLLVSLPSLHILKAFKANIPTPLVDVRFIIARQVAYFLIAFGVLFGVLWVFSIALRRTPGNILSVLSSILNSSFILLMFIMAGAMISAALPPSTILVYGYEANGVTFSDLKVVGTYRGIEVPAGVRRDIISNGSMISAPHARAGILRAEILDQDGARINLTGLNDTEKREALGKAREKITIEGLILSEAVIDGGERIAVAFNVSRVDPSWLNWSSADVDHYSYINATLMGLSEMSGEEAMLATIRRILSPVAWLWVSGVSAYALKASYGLGRTRAIISWAVAFTLMTLMGLV